MIGKEIGKLKHRLLALMTELPPVDANPETNGEYQILAFLSNLQEINNYHYVIDIGANIGNWTCDAIKYFENKIQRFYCVEPIPQFADFIRDRYAENSSVIVMETLVSNISGVKTSVYSTGGGGTMYLGKENFQKVKETNKCESGGKLIQQFDVESKKMDELFANIPGRTYMVKVDCDGHDWYVLLGMAETIKKNRPVIQFEYCDFWLKSQAKLEFAYKLLDGLGYDLYRLFPNKLVRFKYHLLCETYSYQNILAIPKEFNLSKEINLS